MTDRANKRKRLKRSLAESMGDEPACEACGWKLFDRERTVRTLCLHHLHASANGGSDSRDNTALLCLNCHAVAHILFPLSIKGVREPIPVPHRKKFLREVFSYGHCFDFEHRTCIHLLDLRGERPENLVECSQLDNGCWKAKYGPYAAVADTKTHAILRLGMTPASHSPDDAPGFGAAVAYAWMNDF